MTTSAYWDAFYLDTSPQSQQLRVSTMTGRPSGGARKGNVEASSLGEKLAIRSSTDLDWGFPSGSVVKNPPVKAGDASLMPGSGRCPGEGNGNPLQYSCLENPMGRGAWRATVHGAAKSRTQPSTHGTGSG